VTCAHSSCHSLQLIDAIDRQHFLFVLPFFSRRVDEGLSDAEAVDAIASDPVLARQFLASMMGGEEAVDGYLQMAKQAVHTGMSEDELLLVMFRGMVQKVGGDGGDSDDYDEDEDEDWSPKDLKNSDDDDDEEHARPEPEQQTTVFEGPAGSFSMGSPTPAAGTAAAGVAQKNRTKRARAMRGKKKR
jgi:hypothetical protein